MLLLVALRGAFLPYRGVCALVVFAGCFCPQTARGSGMIVEDDRHLSPKDDPYSTLVEPGDSYVVMPLRIEIGSNYRRLIAFVRCQIVEPAEHSGLHIFRFVNLPAWWKPRARGRIGRRSNLWADCVSLSGRRPPAGWFELERLYAADSMYRAKIVTVSETQGEGGRREPMHVCEHYSRIDRFLGQVAGSTPLGGRAL